MRSQVDPCSLESVKLRYSKLAPPAGTRALKTGYRHVLRRAKQLPQAMRVWAVSDVHSDYKENLQWCAHGYGAVYSLYMPLRSEVGHKTYIERALSRFAVYVCLGCGAACGHPELAWWSVWVTSIS